MSKQNKRRENQQPPKQSALSKKPNERTDSVTPPDNQHPAVSAKSAQNTSSPKPVAGWWERKRQWLRKNEVFFNVAESVAIVITVLFAVWNLYGMQQQIKAIDKQTQAMWYQSRPVVSFDNGTNYDIIGQKPDTLKCRFKYRLLNTGREHADLDSVRYIITDTERCQDTTRRTADLIIIAPGVTTAIESPHLIKQGPTILTVEVYYHWLDLKDSLHSWYVAKIWELRPEDQDYPVQGIGGVRYIGALEDLCQRSQSGTP